MNKTAKIAVFIGLGVAAAYAAANAAGMFILLRKNVRKLKDVESSHNAVHSVGLGRGSVELAPDTENALLACLSGRLDVSFTEAPKKDVNLDLTCILGKVDIAVPASMKIDSVLESGGCVYDLDDGVATAEDAPVLHITGKVRFGTVTVTRAE